VKLRVLLFAELRERAGWQERWLEITGTTTPLQLWSTIASELGADALLPESIRIAVNQQFANPAVGLTDGDEVAFLPPISGG